MSRRITSSVLQAAHAVIAQAGQSAAAGCPPAADTVRKVLTGLPYYSTCDLVAANAAGTYTCGKGVNLRLFGYGIGESPATAGIVSPTRADETHTNLTNGARTNAGENLKILGLMLQVVGAGVVSDPKFAIAALPNLTVAAEMTSGKGRWLLGTADAIPGGAGLYGAAYSAADTANVGAMTASMPGPGAFFRIPGGLDWTAEGTDSRLVIIVNNPNDIVFPGLATVHPATLPLRLKMTLVSVAISDPSVNQ